MSEEMIEQLMESIRRRAARPIDEQWQDMIDRGVINDRGEVLLKGPVSLDEAKRAAEDSK